MVSSLRVTRLEVAPAARLCSLAQRALVQQLLVASMFDLTPEVKAGRRFLDRSAMVSLIENDLY